MAVVILSSGLILVYQPLVAALLTTDYLDVQHEAHQRLGEKITSLEEAVRSAGKLPQDYPMEIWNIRGRKVIYEAKLISLSEDQHLATIRHVARWTHGGKTKKLTYDMPILVSDG